ncbi:hypothetical protein WJR50_14400 [Catalinimonas sp. 4WD22]|uniref:hypothetical protein n=1 Tax=Catalinimonas locisalis TaxID=3133978 RepID=UPI003101A992
MEYQKANQIYYFKVGKGKWTGKFEFRLTDKDRLTQEKVGLINNLLVQAMLLFQKLLGKARIDSEIKIYPDKYEIGSAFNVVRIHKYGLTLYLLREEYILDPNGKDVVVNANDRFGPFPFLLNKQKSYPAEILDEGLQSRYYMPLLGSTWVCEYSVKDHDHVDGLLKCKWGESIETIHRL